MSRRNLGFIGIAASRVPSRFNSFRSPAGTAAAAAGLLAVACTLVSTDPAFAQPATVTDEGLTSGFQDVWFGHHKRGRATVAADFDLDGRPDLFVGNPGEESFILRNTTSPGGAISFALHKVLFTGDLAWGAAVADYDNDGDYDLFVPIGANEGIGFDYLLKNTWMESGQTNLDFIDVTLAAGVAGPRPTGGDPIPVASANAIWGDYDLDGDVDLFVNVNIHTDSLPINRGRNILWRNNGNGTFTDVTIASGIGFIELSTRHSTFLDIDNDGDLDLYENNFGGRNYLWENKAVPTGVAQFVDGTFFWSELPDVDMSYPRKAFVSGAGDFNNDGYQDLIVFMRGANDSGSPYGDGHVLYLNQKGEKFVNIANAAGLNNPYVSARGVMGCQIGDLNGDGVPDVFIGNGAMLGSSSPDGGRENQLYLSSSPVGAFPTYTPNDALVDFPAPEDPLLQPYPNYPYRTHAVTIVDLDGDGVLDVTVANGGPAEFPDSMREPNRLFTFDWATPFNWFKVRPVGDGVTVSRDAIGTRFALEVSKAGGPRRTLYNTLFGGNAFSSHGGFEVYFGLGDADTIHSLRLTWPDRTVETVYSGLSINTTAVLQKTAPAGQVPPTVTATLVGGGDVRLDWASSCVGTDTDFSVYEGSIGGTFSSHSGIVCSTAGALTQTITPSPGSAYYLVVPNNGQVEGSYGTTRYGFERYQGAATCTPSHSARCPL